MCLSADTFSLLLIDGLFGPQTLPGLLCALRLSRSAIEVVFVLGHCHHEIQDLLFFHEMIP